MTFKLNSIFRHGWLKRWLSDRRGVVAVEFSLVGIPFILMTVGIIELSLMFTAQSVLHESTFVASRMIRTGQLQKTSAGGQEAMFRDKVCKFSKALIPCSKINFQVKKLNSFADATNVPIYDKDGKLVNTGFDAGKENDVVLVRVAYNYPILTPMMAPFLSKRADKTRPLISTIVLRTEPYQ